ncbi:uncharacterized protein TM35_000142930 [Trypanosoma theileri]|uniref:Uncharacterized protein n=1 Tax=Trypanosoma theileri TaxID=67003 RepID=A0A1X0NWM8_9TRYP|nr:uncharacterized protein TM35_000142930 [Trypanosoma theileri]ORC89082.1 hypothetical protein TM35_000142930 [Trypanosoma theileri]
MSLSGSEADDGPSVLVEQLYDGVPYDVISFPDAFAIPPKSWKLGASMRKSAPLISSNAAHHPDVGDLNTSSHPSPDFVGSRDSQRLMVRRGVHEEQRLLLLHRARQRLLLQALSGQYRGPIPNPMPNSINKSNVTYYTNTITSSEGQRTPRMPPFFATGPTAEQRRRDEWRDAPHAAWAAACRSKFEWVVAHRQERLAALQTRRQERLELEHYAGSSRDKLLLSRTRHRTAARAVVDEDEEGKENEEEDVRMVREMR